ncbi:MAG: hypothetical protein GX452_13395, partial [Ignavibacteriales bacterium]|nr:hypothetical protein [Ignavibacteriales bacterium]
MKKAVRKNPAAKGKIKTIPDIKEVVHKSRLAKHFKNIDAELCNKFHEIYEERITKYLPRLQKGKRNHRLLDVVQIINIEILLFTAYLGELFVVYPYSPHVDLEDRVPGMIKSIENSLDIIISHNSTQDRIGYLFSQLRRNMPEEKLISIIGEIQKFY